MNFYAAFLRMVDPEKSAEHRPAHVEFLKKMKAEGKACVFGRFADGAGGLVIYKADSLEEATAYAQEDPYIVHKARELDIHEWATAGGTIE